MKTLLIGILLLGLYESNHDKKVTNAVNEYINWTTMGKSSSRIFGDEINFTYQISPDEFASGSFENYRVKIESGAKTISRTISVEYLEVIENKKAIATLTDDSTGDYFSLVHEITLIRNHNRWLIESIRIFSKD